jgi:putative transposase
MTLGERINLAREALAQGLAPLPIVLSALEIPRATWYYYRKQKVEADRKREEEERRLKRAIEEILLEHPEYGYRRVTEELHRKGIPINHKRVHRLLQDFHLSLKRTARRPKPNPLLQIVLLAGDKADLRASLLKQREPEPFELLYTDFTLLPYRGGKAWFMPILGQPLEHGRGRWWPSAWARPLQRSWPWGRGRRPRPFSRPRWGGSPRPWCTMTRGVLF